MRVLGGEGMNIEGHGGRRQNLREQESGDDGGARAGEGGRKWEGKKNE